MAKGYLTFYVGDSQDEANQVRGKLNEIGGSLGLSIGGRGAGARLLEAIAGGQAVVLLVAPEDRAWVAAEIARLAEKRKGPEATLLRRVAAALDVAA